MICLLIITLFIYFIHAAQRPRKKMRYSEDWDCDDFGDSMIDELSNSSFASLSSDSNSNVDSGYGGDVQYDTDWSTTNITMMLRKILNHTFLVKKPYQIVDGMYFTKY